MGGKFVQGRREKPFKGEETTGGEKKEKKEKKKGEGCNTRTSQEVTHPSTTLAQARLTAEF